MFDGRPIVRCPWAWIPTLYFAEGLPYALTMAVTLVLYKNLGMSNAAITFYTGWLYLPWVVKPLWSPIVDLLKTRRQWIWASQLMMGGGLAGVALAIPTNHFLQMTLAFFWLLAFSSATHDIAADGFYLLANTEQEQAFFSGIRNTSYRLASISAQGGMVMLAGVIHDRTGNFMLAWTAAFGGAAGLYHDVFARGLAAPGASGALRAGWGRVGGAASGGGRVWGGAGECAGAGRVAAVVGPVFAAGG